MTLHAPPTKNSCFCSTEGAGAQPVPGSVAAAVARRGGGLGELLSAPRYRAGAAAGGKCRPGSSLPVGRAAGPGLRRGRGAYLPRARLLFGSKEGEVRCVFRLVPEPVGRDECAGGKP